ncbi:hypothetical protein [Microbacterium sp. NPDC087589]|uniref:hypothetical protein n=1 Tax=Microbacterium sp. NPDC087589 TaxID=3364191 RepID=UPI003814C44F
MKLTYVAAVAAILSPLLLTGAADAGATALEERETVGDVDQLSQEELDLLGSDEFKRVIVDPVSGDITAVEPLTEEQLESELVAGAGPQARTAYPSACSPISRPCWRGAVPNIDIGFSTGTTTGTWSGRANFWTGNYYAKLCWLDPFSANPFNPSTVCMPERNGNKAWIEIGYTVVGKSVNVSSTR